MNKKHLLLIIIITFTIAVFSYRAAFALFSSQAANQNNTFTASNVFPTATPSASPTPSPATSNLFVSNDFTCSAGAADTTTSKGTVSITKTGDLTIFVTLTGALPNTAYDLWVNQDSGACPLPSPTTLNFITTDGSGNGSKTLNSHSLVGGATNF